MGNFGTLFFLLLISNLSRDGKKVTYQNSKVHGQFKTIKRSRKERNLLTFDGYRKVDIFPL